VSDRDELLAGIKAKGIVHGDFVLSSGQRASSYVDLRRVTLDGRLAPLVGRVLLNATADLSYEAVGGLTLGADPVAAAMMHAAANRGTPIDAFVVRKAEKTHGLQRRIEGPEVKGRRVLALEDTSTTGDSVLTAVDVLEAAGAELAGVAVLVDRGASYPSWACKRPSRSGDSSRTAAAAASLRNSRSLMITNPTSATTTRATTM
jgi:orotate phosphoribosyltransferase